MESLEHSTNNKHLRLNPMSHKNRGKYDVEIYLTSMVPWDAQTFLFSLSLEARLINYLNRAERVMDIGITSDLVGTKRTFMNTLIPRATSQS
jgi:hypothetical protein